MTAEPVSPRSRRVERSPDAIRSALAEDLRREFDAEYLSALDAAKNSYRLDELSEVVERWWCIAVATRDPGHRAAIERGMRLLAGENVSTVPADIEALRR